MSAFDKRETTFETKFAHDAEVMFKVTARRNKLFGLWIAEKLGKSDDEAAAYAKEVVVADFDKPGDDDVIEKVVKDLQAAGLDVPVATLKAQLAKLADQAKAQMMSEA
jgi:hypothetical protein